MDENVSLIALGVPELVGALIAMAAVIWALIRYFIGREMDRMARIEEDVSELRSSSVSRTEFNQTVNVLRDEIRMGNSETHRRLDQLMLMRAEKQ